MLFLATFSYSQICFVYASRDDQQLGAKRKEYGLLCAPGPYHFHPVFVSEMRKTGWIPQDQGQAFSKALPVDQA